MRTKIVIASFVLSGLFVSARGDEEKIPLDRVPAAVRKAVTTKFPKAELKGASKEVEKGKTTYEIQMTLDGRNVDVLLEEGGKILAVEKEIAAKDLPAAVSGAIKAKYPDAPIKKAEEITEGETKKFEVVLTVGKKTVEVVLDPKGKILDTETSED